MKIAIAAILSILSIPAWATPPTPTTYTYASFDVTKEQFDLYRPQGDCPGPLALIMFFHGGSFIGGDKALTSAGGGTSDTFVDNMLAKCFAVASVNYRFGVFPIPMDDAKYALQWIRWQATTLGLDKTRVCISGSSAGGGIAQWLAFHAEQANPGAVTPQGKESTRVSCMIGIMTQTTYTPRDYDTMFGGGGAATYPDFIWQFFGVTLADLSDPAQQAAFDNASPLKIYSADDPPVLYVYPKSVPATSDPATYIHSTAMTYPMIQRAFTQVTVRIETILEDTYPFAAMWAASKTQPTPTPPVPVP